ncbi:hypothetical protein V8C86DRAFT_2659331 [Haematococcus lacustris]
MRTSTLDTRPKSLLGPSSFGSRCSCARPACMRPGLLPAGRLSCRRPAALTLSAEAHTNESEEERVSRIRAQVTRRIKRLGEQGAAKEAIKELTSLNALGIAPDTQAATALLSACLRDMELAQSVFDELFVDFLQPDEITFAVLLRGYGFRKPADWVKMDSVLTTMRTKYNMEPTAISYNVLLSVCVRTNDLERGEDVIDRMHQDGVEPNEFTEACLVPRRSLRSYFRKTFR